MKTEKIREKITIKSNMEDIWRNASIPKNSRHKRRTDNIHR